MTHLLDTSALLAHYLGEPGVDAVQRLFERDDTVVGTSILALFEFDLRLHQLGVDANARAESLERYRALFDEIIPVDEQIRGEAIRLRLNSPERISAMDILIAASASLHGATLVHRDPHFDPIPPLALRQLKLPEKEG